MHRPVEEFADVRERLNGALSLHRIAISIRFDVVQKANVLPPRQIRQKTPAKIEQRSDAAVNCHRSGRWLEQSRNHMKKRRLAGAIGADDRHCLPASDLKADVPEDGDRRMKASVQRMKCFAKAMDRRREETKALYDAI